MEPQLAPVGPERDESEREIRRQLDGLVLGRIGHYSYGDSADGPVCLAALVTKVTPEGDGTIVNLAVWWSSGEPIQRTGVRVGEPTSTATFHLNRDCPWGR